MFSVSSCLKFCHLVESKESRWKLICFTGKIFIVGGNDGTSALNSTEVYDPDNHSWSLGPSLNSLRANCGVAALDGCLFAVGGFNGKKFLNTMEYLDFSKDGFWLSHIPHDERNLDDENVNHHEVRKGKCSQELNGQEVK